MSLLLRPEPSATTAQLEQAAAIIRRRLSGLGVSRADVVVQGGGLIIRLAPSQNAQQIIEQASADAVLLLRPVYCEIPAFAPPGRSAAGSVSQADCNDTGAARLPSTPSARDVAGASVILPTDPAVFAGGPGVRYVLGPADMTGTAIADTSVVVDQATGQYSIQLTLTPKGAAQFDSIAAGHFACYQRNPSNPPYCSEEAFDFDGIVESAPTFEASSFAGNVSITGNFTAVQAKWIANDLKYGALPVRLVLMSVQTSG